MQTKHVPLWTLCLVAVFAASSCAPAATPPPAAATQPEVRAEPSPSVAAPTAAPAIPSLAAATVPAESPLPVATSRGPDLEATDPTTVNLAAGQLQLVEFFRFT
jgi:hypothetical protein